MLTLSLVASVIPCHSPPQLEFVKLAMEPKRSKVLLFVGASLASFCTQAQQQAAAHGDAGGDSSEHRNPSPDQGTPPAQSLVRQRLMLSQRVQQELVITMDSL